jgi:iron complex transport system permease protein
MAGIVSCYNMLTNPEQTKKTLIQCLLILFLALSLFMGLCVGRYRIHVADVARIFTGQEAEDELAKRVIFSMRLPRILLAFAVGAGLSVSGLSLQAMFGNPLVSSHILGISACSGFGAALGILLSGRIWLIQGLALIFGLLGMGVALLLSRQRGGGRGMLTLVLSGIIVAAVSEALTSLIKYVADPEEKLPAITYWLMGSLSSVAVKDMYTGLPVIAVGIAVLWALSWQLNVISLKDEESVSLGLNVKFTRMLIIVATTLICAAVVSVCGIVSFVGLAVPHFVRMLLGNDNRDLVPAGVTLGGAFLIIIDTAARSISAAEIPLSILTAVIGAPVFGILLRETGGRWND